MAANRIPSASTETGLANWVYDLVQENRTNGRQAEDNRYYRLVSRLQLVKAIDNRYHHFLAGSLFIRCGRCDDQRSPPEN